MRLDHIGRNREILARWQQVTRAPWDYAGLQGPIKGFWEDHGVAVKAILAVAKPMDSHPRRCIRNAHLGVY
jgi:hypothetical protein